jgi:uncharacterized OsmC-like protein
MIERKKLATTPERPTDATGKISAAWERSIRGLSKRPQLGKVTHSVTARMIDGLTCAVDVDAHRLVADQPEVAGGNDRGLPPSLYLEAALASCLAIGYRQRFAATGVPVSAIEVEVTATIDVCGQYGLDDTKLGFDGPVTYAVRVDSSAADEAVLEVLDWVDARSPLANILRKPIELRRQVRVGRAGG